MPIKAPITEPEIAERARQLWLAQGSPNGRDVEIWLEAERQLTRERAVDSPEFRPATRRRGQRSVAADEIDETELVERMDSIGESRRRSPTSAQIT